MSNETDPAFKKGQMLAENACLEPERVQRAVEGTGSVLVDKEAEFQADWAAAIAEGRVFAVSEADFNTRVAALIPKLAKVRQHAAQRREDYVKGSRKGRPKWGTLLKLFRAETGVTLCDKTIKKLIDEIEGIKPIPRPKKPRTKTIAPSMQMKMGLALIAVQEMLENVSEQGTVILKQEDITVIRQMLPSAEVLERLVSSLPEESESAPTSDVLSEALAARPEPANSSLENMQPEQSALKTGDGAGLAAAMLRKCAPDLTAVLGGLSPDGIAANVESLTREILEMFRQPGSGRFSTQTRHIPVKPKGLSSRQTGQRPQNPSLFDVVAPGSQLAH